MSIGSTRLTKADHGRRMTWDEYVHAEADEELFYELSRGILTVIEVPHWKHLRRCDLARRQFYRYGEQFPDRIFAIASGTESRLPVESLESDRHPDITVYKTAPPEDLRADEFWSNWIPEIVIEVVSLSSVARDYEEKPDEYFQFGVREYWIIDGEKNEMLVLRRSGGRWKRIVVRPGEPYRSPTLPNFDFNLADVLELPSPDEVE